MRDDQYIVWDKVSHQLEKHNIKIKHITGGRDNFRCWDTDDICYQINKSGNKYKVLRDTGIRITID